MASIGDPNGRRRIQFVAPDGSRKAIRLGKIDRKSAESICRHVEALLSAKVGGQTTPRDTAAWLSALGDALKAKLAAVGLVDAPKRAILGEFLRGYILSRPDVKPATMEVWQQPCRNLIDFFGDDKPLQGITSGDCDQFLAWLLTEELATTTFAKRLPFARTFFHLARKHKLVDENPFAEVKIPTVDESLASDSSTAIPSASCSASRTPRGGPSSHCRGTAACAARRKCYPSNGSTSTGIVSGSRFRVPRRRATKEKKVG